MNPSQNTLQKWDARYLRLARMVASWSKDPSTQCGAVLVRPDKTLCSVGYNGFPRGAPDTPTLYSERSQKYPRIIHSEWNAIANARDPDVAGYTVYAWPMPPCNQCTGALIQKKISRFVQPQPSAEKLERWGVAFSYARKMLEQCNIEVSQPIVDDLFELDLPHFEIGTQVWHARFLAMAQELSTWSKDKDTGSGAILVRQDKTIASIGFSGFPQGVDDAPVYAGESEACKIMMISAARNALLFSKDSTHQGHTAYIWPGPPDLDAVSHLAHEGVKTIVYPVFKGKDTLDNDVLHWFLSMDGQFIQVDVIQ